MADASFLQIALPKRHLAIAATVVDTATAQPVKGAIASITSGPDAFQQLVAIEQARSAAAWSSLERRVERRVDRTVTPADGFFGFADLPDGAYTVTVSAPTSLWYAAASRDFTVKRDAHGDIAVPMTTILLAPTGVRGTVLAEDSQSGMSLARVRVEGSGEVAHCDATGAFLLLGVQPGSRRLSIAASGYRRGAAAATVTLGQIVDLGTIPLQPAGA